MKVIALKPGFFGKLRAVGDEFEVPDDTKKSSWFAPVKVEKPKAEKPSDKPATDLV